MRVSATEPAARSGDQVPFRFRPGGFLLVLTGPSGAGKGTLVDRLIAVRPECVFSVSSTTRVKRGGEREGVQYEFVSRTEFEKRRSAGHFLEWAEVHGELYGTPAKFLDEQVRAGRVVVLDVDVQGGGRGRMRSRCSCIRRPSTRCASACAGGRPTRARPWSGVCATLRENWRSTGSMTIW